jgi:Acetyltransferase (isoleucine patch superfamily)
MLRLFDRVLSKCVRLYRKRAFLAKINSKEKTVKIKGRVEVLATSIQIGKNVAIYDGVSFNGDGKIVIGDNCAIGKDTIIYASKNGGVSIGNNVAIAAQCYIIDCDHGIQKGTLIREQEVVSKPIVIKNDVWVAANCTILKGSVINNGVVIGGMSLVNSEIPENGIAVGIPAKVIKYRS